MTFLLLLPAILSFLVLGAHYLRAGNYLLVGMCLITPFLLLMRQRFILRAIQLLLVLAFMEWLLTAWEDAQQRMIEGQPFLRMVAILAGVGAFALLGALLMQVPWVKSRYPVGGPKAAAGFPVEPPKDPSLPEDRKP